VDVAAWLHSLGMERYEPVFRENAIDPDVLRNLTADELEPSSQLCMACG